MKSPSARAYELGVMQAATFESNPKHCRHPQAEPVILSNGDLVACVCIGCYDALSPAYIEDQLEQALRVAYCTHEDTVEITPFGKADRVYTCTECGSWLSDSTWPTLHG